MAADHAFRYVTLLLPFNQANAATSTDDKSLSQKAVTFNANAAISTTQSKFGGSSLALDGTGDYLSLADLSDFNLLSGSDFTLEAWIYISSLPATAYGGVIVAKDYNNNGYQLRVSQSGTNLELVYPGLASVAATANFSINTWYHVSGCRRGTQHYMSINGTVTAVSLTNRTADYAGTLRVGSGNYAGAEGYFNGYIDDLRITKGLARYTANFTAPVAPHPICLDVSENVDTYYDNVVLALQMDGANASTAIVDDAPSPKVMTCYGNAALSTAQSKFGGSSAYLDGTGDYIYSGALSGIAIGTGDFTVEFWVRPDSVTGFHEVFFVCGPSANQGSWGVLTNGTEIRFNYATDGLTFSSALDTTGAGLAVGTWTHVAVVRLSGTVTIFINGVNKANAARASAPYSTTIGICIGAYLAAPTYYQGYIDDVRFTKGVARYTANFTAPTAPFTTNKLTLNGDQYFAETMLLLHGGGASGSTVIVDNSPSPKTISVAGNAALSTTQSKFGGSSIYFDGAGDRLYTPMNSQFDMGSGDFTIEFWYFPVSAAASDRILQTRDGDVYPGLYISHTSATGVQFYFSSTGAAFQSPGITITVASNTWQHIAVVRTGDTCKMFINGTQSGGDYAVSGAMYYNAADTMIIGGQSTGRTINGYINDFRLTKGIARYTATFTPHAQAHPDAPQHYGDPYRSSVSALLKFNGNDESTSIVDRASSPKTFTAYGNAKQSIVNPKWGSSCLLLDGTGDYIKTADISSLGAGAWCIEGWIRFESLPGVGAFASIVHAVNANGYGVILYMYNGGGTRTLDFAASGNGTTWNIHNGILGSKTTWSAGVYYHIAVLFTGTAYKVYVDGVQDITYTSSTSVCAITQILFGSGYAGSDYFDGRMDDLRITIGQARYTAAFQPPRTAHADFAYTIQDPLWNSFVKSLLNMNGVDTSTTFLDSAISPKTITAYGNAQLDTTAVRAGTACGQFDGTGDYLTIPYSTTDFDWWDKDFTIEAWVNPNTLTGWYYLDGTNKPTLIGNAAPGATTNYWSFGVNSGGVISLYYWNGGGNTVSSTLTVPTTVWTHIAVTKSAQGITLFVNGVPSTPVAVSGTPQSSVGTVLTIGSVNNTSINGYIDDLRITKGVARYTDKFTPPQAQLFANYYAISGSVYDDTGTLASRTVRIYNRATGVLVQEVTSAGGAFTANQIPSSDDHYAVCLDDAAGTSYNALIYDKITPA